MDSRIPKLFGLIILLSLTAACGNRGELPVSPISEESYFVDPLFRDFYEKLGGREILGAPISPVFSQEGIKCQYTDNALMIFDPSGNQSIRYRLSPLGNFMQIEEPPVPPPQDPNLKYIEGHIVHPEFVPLFEKLGQEYVGRPLTEIQYNSEKGRYEQYFQNLGFYRLENDPPGRVFLLSYGVWNCDNTCRLNSASNATVHAPEIALPFQNFASRWGNDFTGTPLTEVYVAEDGHLEQIFENVVLADGTQLPGRVFLRPVPQEIGIIPDGLQSRSNDPGMFFYEIGGGRGYNVPQYFLDFITAHGGLDVSGPPVTELSEVRDGVFRQCFTNLCLRYEIQKGDNGRISVDSLGYTYKEIFYKPDVLEQPTPQNSSPAITMQIREANEYVSSDQTQEISVTLRSGEMPMPNTSPVAVLTVPDGSQAIYTFLPTDADGRSQVEIPAIQAPNGTLIPYQVCIPSPTGSSFCVQDSYLIWNNP